MRNIVKHSLCESCCVWVLFFLFRTSVGQLLFRWCLLTYFCGRKVHDVYILFLRLFYIVSCTRCHLHCKRKYTLFIHSDCKKRKRRRWWKATWSFFNFTPKTYSSLKRLKEAALFSGALTSLCESVWPWTRQRREQKHSFGISPFWHHWGHPQHPLPAWYSL